MRIFSLDHWRARLAPAFSLKRSAAEEFGRLLPYNAALEEAAARHRVFRLWGETDKALAHRWALAVCEAIERHSQEIADLEAELDAALAYGKEP